MIGNKTLLKAENSSEINKSFNDKIRVEPSIVDIWNTYDELEKRKVAIELLRKFKDEYEGAAEFNPRFAEEGFCVWLNKLPGVDVEAYKEIREYIIDAYNQEN